MKLPVNYNKLSPEQRRDVRTEYVGLQNGLCYHCKGSLDDDPPQEILAKKVNKKLFPKNFFKWPEHLHHNHDTGMTIGTVHAFCNAVLWQYHGE